MSNKKEITQYKNQVNAIPMRKWTAEEMNFFFALLTKLKNHGTETLEFNKSELTELANYSDYNLPRFKKIIENLGNHITNLKYYEKTENMLRIMPLFQEFEFKWEKDLSDFHIKVSLSPKFEYILNGWNEGNWTKFMLNEFVQIESTYSKTLFRLLKQWKTVGKREFDLDEFKRLMDIPESYQTGIINHRIINNSVKDLEPYFTDLKVKTIKANTRGNPVIGYKFTWDPEKTDVWEQDKYKAVPDKKQTYKPYKKKRYRSKNSSEEAKEFAKKAREQRFARMLAEKEKEQGQTGEEILEEIRKEEGKDESI